MSPRLTQHNTLTHHGIGLLMEMLLAPMIYTFIATYGIVPVSVILLGIVVIAGIIVKRLAVSTYSIKRYKRLLETRDSAKL